MKPLVAEGTFNDNLGIGMIRFQNAETIPEHLTVYHKIRIACSKAYASSYEKYDHSGAIDIFLDSEHPYFVVRSREDMEKIFDSINRYNGEFDAKTRLTNDIISVVRDALKVHFENTPIEHYTSVVKEG